MTIVDCTGCPGFGCGVTLGVGGALDFLLRRLLLPSKLHASHLFSRLWGLGFRWLLGLVVGF